jgi:hypothetical protein
MQNLDQIKKDEINKAIRSKFAGCLVFRRTTCHPPDIIHEMHDYAALTS